MNEHTNNLLRAVNAWAVTFTHNFFERNPDILIFEDCFAYEGDKTHFEAELAAYVRELIATEKLLVSERDAFCAVASAEVNNVWAQCVFGSDYATLCELRNLASLAKGNEGSWVVYKHSEDGRYYLGRSLGGFGTLGDHNFRPARFCTEATAMRVVSILRASRARLEAKLRRRYGPESTVYDDMPGGPTVYGAAFISPADWDQINHRRLRGAIDG